ncbi:MAG: PEP/pyruvate-binding domain-containing protein [Desulfobacteraceae bacterium]|nr:PEP/pyruvate-binding domain-containing protein [Desulfobacteraceae bacterium]
MSWISWFDELGQESKDLVGKKCANLGEMTRMGLRVPQGFALSLEAYKDFMSLTGAAEEIKEYLGKANHDFEEIRHFNEASAELRRIVESKDLPPEMKEAIVSHYQELCRRCIVEEVAVSTRSAGAASHPGQYQTYLNVIGESDLREKVIKVWSSTFNPRSLSARKRAGVPLENDPIGVAVLKMVNARSAGVLFTADPNTGDPSRMIIEANWGLGESVVGGEAMPDVYILEKEGLEVIERKLGSKGKYITFKEVGVVEEETPSEKSESLCLSNEEAKEIGRLGKILETHFGVPQDAEWAIDQDLKFPESVILLQTRPEVIAQQKEPVEQVLDLMLGSFGS